MNYKEGYIFCMIMQDDKVELLAEVID